MAFPNINIFCIVDYITGWENLGNILFNTSYAVYSIYFIYTLKIYSSSPTFQVYVCNFA